MKHRNVKPKQLKALEGNIGSIKEDPSVAKNFKNKTSFRICIKSCSCATVLQTQYPPGENWPPRSSDKPVSIGKTTISAQRNLPGALRIQELSGFQLFLELILCHSAPYPGIFLVRTGLPRVLTYRLQEGQATVKDCKTNSHQK